VELLEVLKALAHPTRLEILQLLFEEPLPFSWLMRRLGLDPRNDASSFNHHLKVLLYAGLITKEVELPRYCLTKLGSYVVRWVRGLEATVRGEEGV